MAHEEEQHGGHEAGHDAHAKGHKSHGSHGHGGGHEEHEEGVPEWVVSFADNVLLQMGFFVILLAMNMGVKAKGPTDDGNATSAAKAQDSNMIDMAIAIREAFNSGVDLDSTRPEDQPLIKRLRERAAAARDGQSQEQSTTGHDKRAQDIRPSEYRTPAAYVDFSDRSSDLTMDAQKILAEAATKIVGTRWIVEVRGHTSRVEITRDIEFSRTLAYQRAFGVAKYLVEQGVSWEQLRVTSSGDSEPVVARPRSTDGHASNQRVEIFQLPESLPPDPYAAPADDPHK